MWSCGCNKLEVCLADQEFGNIRQMLQAVHLAGQADLLCINSNLAFENKVRALFKRQYFQN